MSTATSASDRYAAAAALLAEWNEAAQPDERGLHNAGGFALHNNERIREVLRALIEPPATGETPDLAAISEAAFKRALGDIDKGHTYEDLMAAYDAAREAVYQAGIQAAWESWEPENAPGLVEEARYDRIEGAIRLAFEGEGEAWSDKLSGDRLAAVARRAIEEAGL